MDECRTRKIRDLARLNPAFVTRQNSDAYLGCGALAAARIEAIVV